MHMSILQDLTRIFQEQQQYEELRVKSWEQMKERHQSLTAAFGGEDRVPEQYRKQMHEDNETFREQWSNEHGTYHQALTQHHQARINLKLDKPEKNPQPEISKGQANEKALENKQAKMAALIAQQKKQQQKPEQTKKNKAQQTKPKKAPPANNTASPKEQEKQTLIAQQKAIAQKTQGHSRKR